MDCTLCTAGSHCCAYLVFAEGLFKVGEKAPSFALTAITGETMGLDTCKGKVVVLGLFHICEPCMIQGTAFQKVSEMTKGKDVVVLGVNSSGDSKKSVGEYLSTFPVKVTYPYLLDPNKVTDKFYGGGKFIPNVYVIDQHGVIRWQRWQPEARKCRTVSPGEESRCSRNAHD